MTAANRQVLTVNGGSSSIRFAVYCTTEPMQRLLHGKIDRIGLDDTHLTFEDPVRQTSDMFDVPAENHQSAVLFLIEWLERQGVLKGVEAVGHRIVHGMQHTAPAPLTPELLAALHSIAPYVPEHLPREIELVEAFRAHDPQRLQVACFDTAFHRNMPAVARLLPIPRRYEEQGIQRYGFHGLSYAYLMEELARLDPSAAAHGRVILAHLGNGASMAAVRDGSSIDTSMGFTPTGGLPMSTRSGDLDPGVMSYLMRATRMTREQLDHMVNHEAGLLGLSETSSDLRDLLASETHDGRAAAALALFCYQARKCIGAYAAALGGVDTLVFAGGIGENAPQIRARICAELGFLGIAIDSERNACNAGVISFAEGPVPVRVIRTDEELMIARSTARIARQS